MHLLPQVHARASVVRLAQNERPVLQAKVDEPEPAAPVYKKKGSIHDAVQDVSHST